MKLNLLFKGVALAAILFVILLLVEVVYARVKPSPDVTIDFLGLLGQSFAIALGITLAQYFFKKKASLSN